MANALVVRKTQLPSSQKTCRAAQYVRMSTERQRYSIQNQAAVIGAYAHAHNLIIVRTYSDEGVSGLRIKNRAGLTELMEDVRTERADFDWVLVYDVSRWGRFQNVDESAHYEFVCKQAGINVVYCAEQFDNDGSMLSSIVKNLKRVMAAEYSRELSARVHAGACRLSRMGFKVGGNTGYALQPELVDEKLHPKGVLKRGDRKYLITDHVRLRHGTTDEVAVVRWIFQRFLRLKSETPIAAELNRKAIPTNSGGRWGRALVNRILRNENHVGNLVYNRLSRKLGEKKITNSPDLWVRSEGCVDPIIEMDVFLKAKKLLGERRVQVAEGEMLARLRRTLMKERRLSPALINDTVGLPSTASYRKHFGNLRNVYRLIGYTSKRNCEYLDSRQMWDEQIAKLSSAVAAGIGKAGGCIVRSDAIHCLYLKGGVSISFRVARWHANRKDTHLARWCIQRRTRLPAGFIVAIRLTEHNTAALDYLLLPTTGTIKRMIRFTERTRTRQGILRFGTAAAVAQAVSRRVTKPGRVSPTKPPRPNKETISSRSKRKTGRARR